MPAPDRASNWRGRSGLPRSPLINGAGCWNRTNASRLSIAGSTFELILPWCAVRELNPHLLVVGQLFWSVELPARNISWWRMQESNLPSRADAPHRAKTARVGDPAD